ncbi:MAG TPA: PqqD family protein [Gaiellaceae bacterium]|nr:PqqD family protein [Gaiellaceae bacterium]
MTADRAQRLRPDALRWREVDREVIAVDLGSSTYLSTNESGLVLWRRLAEGATRRELAAELQERFAIDASRAEIDVDNFLRALAERDLLEDVDDET